MIHEVEYSFPGPMFNLVAIYVGDPQRYLSYPPAKDAPFTATGIRDPALGNTGPLSYAKVEALEVHAIPRHSPPSAEYGCKFAALASMATSIQGIRISESSIVLGRSTA
jgi:hypothetical protein